MGTGGFLTLGHQRILSLRWKLHNDYKLRSHQLSIRFIRAYKFRSLRSLHSSEKSFRKSPRPISISRLKMLPLLHL